MLCELDLDRIKSTHTDALILMYKLHTVHYESI